MTATLALGGDLDPSLPGDLLEPVDPGLPVGRLALDDADRCAGEVSGRQFGEHLSHLLGARERREAVLLALAAVRRRRVMDVEHAVVLRPVPHGGDLVEADAPEQRERVVLVAARLGRLDGGVRGVVVVLVVGLDLAAVHTTGVVDGRPVHVEVFGRGVERRAVGQGGVGTEDDLVVGDPADVVLTRPQSGPRRRGRRRRAGRGVRCCRRRLSPAKGGRRRQRLGRAVDRRGQAGGAVDLARGLLRSGCRRGRVRCTRLAGSSGRGGRLGLCRDGRSRIRCP